MFKENCISEPKHAAQVLRFAHFGLYRSDSKDMGSCNGEEYACIWRAYEHCKMFGTYRRDGGNLLFAVGLSRRTSDSMDRTRKESLLGGSNIAVSSNVDFHAPLVCHEKANVDALSFE